VAQPRADRSDVGRGEQPIHPPLNTNYINDLKSIVSKARANNLGVILDMHQDYWSPSMHNFTYWDGRKGYCEGVGMPRWLNPSIDAKATTMQTTDFYNAMNWFYRNIHDPARR
jgi:hypothetical protein